MPHEHGYSHLFLIRVRRRQGGIRHLEPGDPQRRIHFCHVMDAQMGRDVNFQRRICFTNECTFDRQGMFNQRNSHFWAAENPWVIQLPLKDDRSHMKRDRDGGRWRNRINRSSRKCEETQGRKKPKARPCRVESSPLAR